MISIIIPAFNAEKYIEATLDSILNQTYTDFELICIDDGSVDNTLNIIQSYQMKKNKKQKLTIITGEHNGLHIARNKGIFEAHGEYLLFFDADDLMSPDYLECLMKGFENPDVDIVFGNAVKFKDNESDIIKDFKANQFFYKSEYDLFLISDCVTLGDNLEPICGTKLYKSNIVFKHNLQFKNIEMYSDILFFMEYTYFASTIYVSQDALMKYRISPSSITYNISSKDLEVIKCFHLIEEFISSTPSVKKFEFEYLLENFKIKTYYLWSLRYTESSAFSKSLRKKLFKAFHKEIINEGEKHYFVLSKLRQNEVAQAKVRYKLRIWYLRRFYILFYRIKKLLN